jgi:hypothetical protein
MRYTKPAVHRPGAGLRERHAPLRNDLLAHCLRLVDSPRETTRALARELL